MIPLNSGDRVSDAALANAIRSLYATGLFDGH